MSSELTLIRGPGLSPPGNGIITMAPRVGLRSWMGAGRPLECWQRDYELSCCDDSSPRAVASVGEKCQPACDTGSPSFRTVTGVALMPAPHVCFVSE